MFYKLEEIENLSKSIKKNIKSIVVIILFSIACSLIYAFSQTKWYSAEVLVSEADENGVQNYAINELSSLAGLAGINYKNNSKKNEYKAVLTSKKFLINFISMNNIKKYLGEDKTDIQLYSDLLSLISVEENNKNGMLTIKVEWIDEKKAVEWANKLVKELNYQYKNEDKKEAELALAFLNKVLYETKVVQIKQNINELIEKQMKKLMLIDSKNDYALKVIDPAIETKTIVRPKKKLIVFVGLILGLLVSSMYVTFKEIKYVRNIKNRHFESN